MNGAITYNVWHTIPFGMLIMLYFFFGGASAGSFLVSAFSKVWGKEKYSAISNIGAILSLILIGMGSLCLLLDLGQPLRVHYLFFKFSPTSLISWGTVILTLFGICNLIYLWFLLIKKDDSGARRWAKIGIPFAVGLGSYTGLLLSMAKTRALWHSAIIAPLFLVSGSIAGLALVLLFANLLNKYSPQSDVIRILRKTLIILIIIDIFFLSDMYVLYVGLAEAREVALLLLVGRFAFLFWGIELLLGSVLPIVFLSKANLCNTKRYQIIASLLALVGVLAMRYIIVIVGQYIPIS